MVLKDFDSALFLRDYWQKKPLLIRNPWDAWQNPLEPDELAGLACEAEVESRLVVGAQGSWAVEHGPLAEARFARLGQEPSTLLVQAVDHHIPEVAALIAPFRFIPNWRIDDVMVSYATDGGGVGPHYDQYDVFLIQGNGCRRWRVGQLCDDESSLVPHDELRLLAEFRATDEWLLEPGDILYVPPRIAHDGVAVGDDCMTYSVGFRAPSRSELLTHFVDDLVAEMEDDDRYADPELATQENPGEISSDALDKLHQLAIEKLQDRSYFARWFGGYSSTRKYPEIDWSPEDLVSETDISAQLKLGVFVSRNPASRFSFLRQDDATILLFVDGTSFHCENSCATFAENLCRADTTELPAPEVPNEPLQQLITALINQGSIALDGREQS
ncbi:MAG TPA: cupin domain-containing protein [Sphingorhabdus lacus]|nr:cupin domain-containing protein [Sphingorhabdus lacus]